MARLLRLVGLLVIVSGCAAEAPRPKAAPLAADLEEWVGSASPRGSSARTTTLAQPRSGDDAPRAGVHARHIAARDEFVERAPRPGGRGRVDVSFQGADMVNAFQFLADAGRFNLVMQDGLTGKVSATLRGVDPYDALVSLAEANGATVKYDRSIVVVSKR